MLINNAIRGIVFFLAGFFLFFIPPGDLYAEGKVLRYALSKITPRTIDPHMSTHGYEFLMYSTMFNGLVRFKPGTTDIDLIEPDLAESWRVSADGTQWTFNLRKGVKWHKGYGDFTAEDVKFSIERVRDPKTASPWKESFVDIKEVIVSDPDTVKIILKKPSPTFILNLVGVRSGCIVPKKAVTELKDSYGLNPVGTGPFEFKRYVSKERVEVVPNKEYFREKERPKIDGIHFIFVSEESSMVLGLMKKDFDLGAGIDRKDFVLQMQKAGLRVQTIGPGAAVLLFMDPNHKPFDDIRVRKAIMHGINNEELTEALYGPGGKVWNTAVPVGYFGYSEDVPQYKYDIGKAKKYLADAGYPKGIEVTTQASIHPVYLPPMIIIQEQLKKIGVNLNLKQVEHATYHSNIRKGINPLVLYSCVRPPDADIFLTEFFHSTNIPGTNFSSYKKADALIEKARSEMNSKKRKADYIEIQRMIMEDAVAKPLYIRLYSPVRQPYIKYNYEIVNTLTYHEDHLEFVTIEK